MSRGVRAPAFHRGSPVADMVRPGRILGLTALAVASLGALQLVFGSSNFQACVSESKKQQSARSRIVVTYAVAYKDCLWRLANENNGTITAVATLLLTFVTGGLVWIGYRQITTSRAQLRAYVFVGEVKIIDPDGTEPQAQITLSNFGQTPAYNSDSFDRRVRQ